MNGGKREGGRMRRGNGEIVCVERKYKSDGEGKIVDCYVDERKWGEGGKFVEEEREKEWGNNQTYFFLIFKL